MACEEIMRGKHWPRTLVAFALLCVPNTSHAAAEVATLDYDVENSCPTRDTFWDSVREKLAAAGVDAKPEEARVTVHIQRLGTGFVGQLALQRADSSYYEREVGGASCAEVSNALAFVLALALGAKDPTTDPSVTAAPTAPVPPAPAPAAEPPATPIPPPGTPRASTAQPRPLAWRLGIGVEGGERAGLSPRLLLVGSAFLEAERTLAPLSGLALRAGFTSAVSKLTRDSNGETTFSWWAGSLELCPLQVRVLGPLQAHPCAALELGRLHVAGNPTPGPGSRSDSASNVWAGALAALRFELPLSRLLTAQLEGALSVPLTHYKIAYDPDATVYTAPALAGAGLIGLSAHFP